MAAEEEEDDDGFDGYEDGIDGTFAIEDRLFALDMLLLMLLYGL